MTAPDIEALTDFLASPGWAWFSEHVTREWGPSGLRYQQAVLAASESDNARVELQKILHTQQQIFALMRYPAEQVTRIRGEKKAALLQSVSRRGPGL